MDVHSVGFLENWGFGDFQCLKSNPNEPQQPIETSHLGGLRLRIMEPSQRVKVEWIIAFILARCHGD